MHPLMIIIIALLALNLLAFAALYRAIVRKIATNPEQTKHLNECSACREMFNTVNHSINVHALVKTESSFINLDLLKRINNMELINKG